MGAIYISPSSVPVPEVVYRVFREKGFGDPMKYGAGSFNILLYAKQLSDSVNHLSLGADQLFIIGTCFYKGKNYDEGLKALLSDYTNDKLDETLLTGTYFLLFCTSGKLHFLTDAAGGQNLYFNDDAKIVSSSFLGAIAGTAALVGRLGINRPAVIENLVTGTLPGPETIVRTINRYERQLHHSIAGIARVVTPDRVRMDTDPATDLNKAVEEQLVSLKRYFDGFYPAIGDQAILSGLTGGFDSRLLLLAADRSGIRPQLYTNSASVHSRQVKIAGRFAKAAGYDLLQPSQNEVDVNLRENFYFNDGQVRVFQIWTEKVKSRSYLKRLYCHAAIGMSGVGGEQYRNSDHLKNRSYNLEKWVSGELVERFSGNVFRDNSERRKLEMRIVKKLRGLMVLPEDKKTVSLSEIKKIQNEVYNPATRLIRNNIENQLVFFLSPFTDASVSNQAYSCIGFLGESHAFEKEMIARLAPALADVDTDYGYPVSGSVPVKYALATRLKTSLGSQTFYRMRSLLQSKYRSPSSANRNQLIDFPRLLDMNLPLNFDRLLANELLSPLVTEMEFFLKEMEAFIHFD